MISYGSKPDCSRLNKYTHICSKEVPGSGKIGLLKSTHCVKNVRKRTRRKVNDISTRGLDL